MGQCFRRALAGRATDGRYGYIRPLSTLQLVAQYCVLYQVPGTGTCICLVSRVRSACARYCTMLCSAAAHDSNVRCVPKLCANDSWLYSIRANSSVLKTLQFIIMLTVLTTDSCGAVGFQLQPTLNLVDIISCKTLSSTPGCSDSFLRTMCCSTSVPLDQNTERSQNLLGLASQTLQTLTCEHLLNAFKATPADRTMSSGGATPKG